MVIIPLMVNNVKNVVDISRKQTVFVGMSGGVDSSVSAALLKKANPKNYKEFFGRPTPKGFRGYDVVGVFIRTWHPEYLPCNEEEERLDAMRVAAHLDIPFLTFDFEDVYKKEVADYMIAEYKAGRTPNPDVMCNKHVKFGAFLKKALEMGADYVATGHYAIHAGENAFEELPQARGLEQSRIYSLTAESRGQSENFAGKFSRVLKKHFLLRGADPTKDQAYFLWTLTQAQLSKILFPVGHLKKSEVRALANKFKLPVADKKDSQGICFLGAVDLKDFLKHYIKEKKGKVLNEKGETIGEHPGAVFFTLGERHGFTITKKTPNDDAYYVVGKDIKKNTLIVSGHKDVPLAQASKEIILKNTNWISSSPIDHKLQTTNYVCQIRYHGEFLPCQVKISKKETKVIFRKPILVASGQSIVVYDGDICLGGGVVI